MGLQDPAFLASSQVMQYCSPGNHTLSMEAQAAPSLPPLNPLSPSFLELLKSLLQESLGGQGKDVDTCPLLS